MEVNNNLATGTLTTSFRSNGFRLCGTIAIYGRNQLLDPVVAAAFCNVTGATFLEVITQTVLQATDLWKLGGTKTVDGYMERFFGGTQYTIEYELEGVPNAEEDMEPVVERAINRALDQLRLVLNRR